MKISVIIPTYNRKERLTACLSAIWSQDFNKNEYEVIVVDDGSEDGTKEMIQKIGKPVNFNYIWHENVGRAANRNIGIRSAKGDIIVFLDDDVVATPQLLQKHYEIHEARGNAKLVVLGYTPFANDINRTLIVKYYEKCWERTFRRAAQEKKTQPYGLVITNNLSVRREFLISVGLFDEDFKNYSYEDSELGYRLWRAGMELQFCRSALAYHHFSTDLPRSRSVNFQSGYSAVIFYNKHPELEKDLSIDVVSGNHESELKWHIKVWRLIKWCIYNDYIIATLSKLTEYCERFFPEKVIFFCYGIINWHYYCKGMKKGLAEIDFAFGDGG